MAPPSMALDPATTGVRVTVLRDGNEVLIRTIPSSLWIANASRRTFKFSDADGNAGLGITKATVSLSRSGAVKVQFKGREMALADLVGPELTLKLDVGGYTFVGSPSCLLRDGARTATLKCRSD